MREKIADILWAGGAQADYADYLEKADQIIEAMELDQIYNAGWNDALISALKYAPPMDKDQIINMTVSMALDKSSSYGK